MKKPFLLMILDGWGFGEAKDSNAIYIAKPTNFLNLWNTYPHTIIDASGKAVGLPDGIMGNSEVGHLNIGAGRVIYQDITLIDKSIETGEFFSNSVLITAMRKGAESKLHIMGLISDGKVHSSLEHMDALFKMAENYGVKKLLVHSFLDGRDTPPRSALKYIKEVESKLLEGWSIATVSGRYYAMDRDKRWDRLKKAYHALVLGEGRIANSASQAIKEAYERGESDEFVLPTVIVDSNGKPKGLIEDGDTVIFLNFRADRAREMTRALTERDFKEFLRPKFPSIYYVCMTEYDEKFSLPVAFPPMSIHNTLGEYLSSLGYTQLRIAETEKYAHVTYFFNGGEEKVFPGERRCLVPSPRVATYDLQPEMSAFEVTEKVLSYLDAGDLDLIVLNFANPDMVGHTGIISAAVKAISAVDICIGRVMEKVLNMGGMALITADHGNAELMVDPITLAPHTAHTTNPVPLILVAPNLKNVSLKSNGKLSDLSPTILDLMNIPKPPQMTGESLIERRGKLCLQLHSFPYPWQMSQAL